MFDAATRLAVWLTSLSIRNAKLVLGVAAVIVACSGLLALRLEKEVGFRGYFGPEDPIVRDAEAFLEEFQTGLHLMFVFGCSESPRCERIDEPWVLDFVGRLHAAVDGLPNVHQVTSVLNLPVVVGELETRPIATQAHDGSWTVAADWRDLFALGMRQGFMKGALVSEDQRTSGLLIELGSTDSTLLRAAVHGMLDLRAEFEAELGAPLYIGGEPAFNVVGGDMLDHDTRLLTVGIFVLMFLVLWVLFRDPWMTVLPVAAIAPLFAMVQGLTALLSIPISLVLGVVPILVLVIALTSSIHFLTAFLRQDASDIGEALRSAADEVGAGCFWAAVTTVAGFSAFLTSGLGGHRHLGGLAATGAILGFVVIFTLLPALLYLRGRSGQWRPAARPMHTLRWLTAAVFGWLVQHSRLVFVGTLGSFLLMTVGISWLQFARDVGFGEDSYVIRSTRFLEEHFRNPESVDVRIEIPEGRRIYDETSLRLLAAVETRLEADPLNGRAWSFLDFLEQAYRVDTGAADPSLEDLIAGARRAMPLVTSLKLLPGFWSETTLELPDGSVVQRDAARVAADKAWSGPETHAYTDRVRAALREVEQEYGPLGYELSLEGGALLLDSFFRRLEETQQRSFALAFGIVVVTLGLLLGRANPVLMFWAVLANLFPVLGLTGLMGWFGAGIDPANAMVAGILLVVVVDDTIHMSLRYLRERRGGASVYDALHRCSQSVGDAIVTSSVCLCLGFCVFIGAEWGGLVWFGVLAATGVLLALVGDLLFLPSALLVTQGRSESPAQLEQAES